jgi:predicted nucleic acid-binding protein
MDDLAARDEASRRGLICVGTLGLLADAHRRDWLAFDNAVAGLKLLGFRVSDSLLADVRSAL